MFNGFCGVAFVDCQDFFYINCATSLFDNDLSLTLKTSIFFKKPEYG